LPVIGRLLRQQAGRTFWADSRPCAPRGSAGSAASVRTRYGGVVQTSRVRGVDRVDEKRQAGFPAVGVVGGLAP